MLAVDLKGEQLLFVASTLDNPAEVKADLLSVYSPILKRDHGRQLEKGGSQRGITDVNGNGVDDPPRLPAQLGGSSRVALNLGQLPPRQSSRRVVYWFQTDKRATE